MAAQEASFEVLNGASPGVESEMMFCSLAILEIKPHQAVACNFEWNLVKKDDMEAAFRFFWLLKNYSLAGDWRFALSCWVVTGLSWKSAISDQFSKMNGLEPSPE